MVRPDFFLLSSYQVIKFLFFPEGIQLFKQYRKAVKIQAKNDGFEEYAAQAVEGFGLKGDAQTHRNKLTSLYHQYEPVLPSIETLIVLQVKS